ncbi:prickle planar cell polarity protein 3 isoform X2 [Patagioenas fasciata]|uniref:prickle planar cell polarity protein 3 isoform X2 n=1 Tax=Patagioenas fasciata TaxID=372321 RepID=UPI003A98E816
MFARGSRRRRSAGSPPQNDPQRGQPCQTCGDQCPGFLVHPWRKICQHCKCPRDEHVAGGAPPELERFVWSLLGDPKPPPPARRPLHKGSDEDSGCPPEEYAWAPPGLTAEQVRQFFACLPEETIPYVNSPGERHRHRQLLRQLPPHDCQPEYCTSLSAAEVAEFQLFAQKRKRESLGRGQARPLPHTLTGAVCQQCGRRLPGGVPAVLARRAGLGAWWHPQCFQCSQCRQLLVDLVYFHGRGGIYCGRHHGETLRPRCRGCDELIFSTRWLSAGGAAWHPPHWCCWECERPLGDGGGAGGGLCPPCHLARRGHLCDTCGEHIGPEQPQLSHRGQHWHARPGCFCCVTCVTPLLGRPFLPRGGQLFCSPLCARSRPPAPRRPLLDRRSPFPPGGSPPPLAARAGPLPPPPHPPSPPPTRKDPGVRGAPSPPTPPKRVGGRGEEAGEGEAAPPPFIFLLLLLLGGGGAVPGGTHPPPPAAPPPRGPAHPLAPPSQAPPFPPPRLPRGLSSAPCW